MNGQPHVFNGGPGWRFGPVFFNHGGGAGHPLAWATFALVLLLVLTVWAMIIARAAGGRPRHWHGPPRMKFRGGRGFDPLAVVKVRYARGEISREEYLQATSDLGGQSEPGG